MNDLADVDGFKICIQVCEWLGFPPLMQRTREMLRLKGTLRRVLKFHNEALSVCNGSVGMRKRFHHIHSCFIRGIQELLSDISVIIDWYSTGIPAKGRYASPLVLFLYLQYLLCEMSRAPYVCVHCSFGLWCFTSYNNIIIVVAR